MSVWILKQKHISFSFVAVTNEQLQQKETTEHDKREEFK
jgi:hypothetical protein